MAVIEACIAFHATGSPTDEQLQALLHKIITRPMKLRAGERQRLEQLCRAAGQVVLKLKTAWRDGITHIVMSPLEFKQRPAALVPRPRLHLIRFHEVMAPKAKLRALVVPRATEDATGES